MKKNLFYLTCIICLNFVMQNLISNENNQLFKKIEIPNKSSILTIKDFGNYLVIGTRTNLHIYNKKKKSFQDLTISDNRYPTCIFIDQKFMIVGTNKGILYSDLSNDELQKGSVELFESDTTLTYSYINDIAYDNEYLYIATNNGVFKSDINFANVENITKNLEIKSNENIELYDNKIIVGQNQGLFYNKNESNNWRLFKTFTRDVKSICVNDTTLLFSDLESIKIVINPEADAKVISLPMDLGEIFNISSKDNKILAVARNGVHISNDRGNVWKSIKFDEKYIKAGDIGDKYYFGTFMGNLYYLDFENYDKIK